MKKTKKVAGRNRKIKEASKGTQVQGFVYSQIVTYNVKNGDAKMVAEAVSQRVLQQYHLDLLRSMGAIFEEEM